MLILSRREQETVTLVIPPSTEPQEVVVTVADIRIETVRLGFTAATEINVVRSELLRAESEKQEHAASHSGSGGECGK